jgi:hypothetical protein
VFGLAIFATALTLSLTFDEREVRVLLIEQPFYAAAFAVAALCLWTVHFWVGRRSLDREL